MAAKWPPLPTVMHGAGGPIRVRQVKRVHTDDHMAAWGTWEDGTRTIRIERGAMPQHRWRVLFHEWAHSVLDDSGVGNLFTAGGTETLCDAIATARMAEMRGTLGITD